MQVPGRNNLIWSGDQEAVIGEIQQFITGVRPRAGTGTRPGDDHVHRHRRLDGSRGHDR